MVSILFVYITVTQRFVGAEPEDRDSAGLSAFHVALQNGHIPVAAYFLETHPPNEDTKAIYSTASSQTLLSLTLDSYEPELVWMILDKGLATTHDINDAWVRVTSGGASVSRPCRSAKDKEHVGDITKLLMRFGGFTPPPTPPSKPTPACESTTTDFKHRPTIHCNSSPEQPSPAEAPTCSVSSPQSGRGRGRGRGYGRGRGHGRSRVPPTIATR